MDIQKIKDEHIGRGIRRLRYEARYRRLKDKDPYHLGIEMGLSVHESILLEEIIEYREKEFYDFVFNYFSRVN